MTILGLQCKQGENQMIIYTITSDLKMINDTNSNIHIQVQKVVFITSSIMLIFIMKISN